MNHEINLIDSEVETSAVPHKPTLRQQYQEPPAAPANQEKKRENEARFQIKRLIEALLFASSEPIGFNKIREVADQLHPLRPRELKDILLELQNEYLSQQRGFRLEEIGQGYLLRTCEEFSSYIELLYRNKRTERLSQAAAEVLAIIAYRQPITKPQIEKIRGVDSSGVTASLLERGLIAPVGKLEAPGRPTLYGITQDFLTHFGIKDLKELPRIEDGDDNSPKPNLPIG